MVTKTPKKKHQFKKNTNLRVHVQKLDENVFEAYQNRRIRMLDNSTSVKEERACIFASEIDLSNDEHALNESGVPSQCNCCSPCHKVKWQNYKEYLEDQENVVNPHPYLCDVIQENVEPFSFFHNEAADVQIQPVVATCDASTQTPSRQFKFECKDCSSQFNNQHYYEQHILAHVPMLYECAFCNATFNKMTQMQSHVLMHKYKNFFECVECSCVFSNKKHLLKHIRSHNRNLFECRECNAEFNTEKGLQNHKKMHISSGKMIHVFRLTKAPQSEPPRELVVEESANVEEEPQSQPLRFFKCSVCHLQFSNVGHLDRHKVIHNRSAAKFLHVCSKCGARFRANNHLNCHMRFAHNALP